MSNWRWVTEPGKIGEVPVRILPEGQAKFLDVSFLANKLIQNSRIEIRKLPGEVDLRPEDVCVLRVKITEVRGENAATIGVEVLGADMVEQAERAETTVEEMMQYLPEAREARQERREEQGCDNCRSIDVDTSLSAEEKVTDYDLHHCADCGRLLSTSEYDQWARLHR